VPKKKKSKSKPPIKSSDLQGLKDLRAVAKLLERLHSVGTDRDKAKNRDLHMDNYCLMVLMWFFNPIIDSMRGLQQASDLKEVQKRLGVGRASLGSLSESVSIFDPEPLAALAQELSEKLPVRTPVNFSAVDKTITAVDGSVFKVFSQITKLAWLPTGDGKHKCGYRLHTQFEVFRGTPSRIDLTPANPKGDADERVVLEKSLESDRCYLMDRGYEKYSLWNAIDAKGSQYVCRIRDNPAFQVLEDRPLSDEAKAENVLSDQIVQFGGEQTKYPPEHPTRVVMVKVNPLDSRSHKNAISAPSSDGILRIVTNNLDIPAELVAALYLLRWTIELYFRMIKQLLGCRHLLSYKSNGVTIQLYLAIIACIMILSITGKTPSKRTFEMICFYLSGWASLDELEEHIKKLSNKLP
jgi:Transposase DDE domain